MRKLRIIIALFILIFGVSFDTASALPPFSRPPLSYYSLLFGGYQAETISYRTRVLADGGIVISIADVDVAIVDAKSRGYYTSLIGWWSPSFGVKLGAGNETLKVYDLSTNNNDLIGISGSAPIWTANQLNSRAAFVYGGAQQLSFPDNTSLHEQNGMLLAGLGNVGVGNMYFAGNDSIASDTNGISLNRWTNIYNGEIASNSTAQYAVSPTWPVLTFPALIGVGFNASTVDFIYNSGTLSQAGRTITLAWNNPFSIGKNPVSTGYYFTGNIYDVVYLKTSIYSTTIKAINFQGTKYGYPFGSMQYHWVVGGGDWDFPISGWQDRGIVNYNGKTHIFYTSIDSGEYYEYGVTFTHSTNSIGTPVKITDAHTAIDPAHFYASAIVDGSGYIHLFYGCHASPLYYRKSTNPNDITAWGAEQTIEAVYASYPHPFIDSSGNLYVIYRGGDTYYHTTITMQKSTNGGTTWTPTVLVDGGNDTNMWAYPGNIAIGSDDSIHMAWGWRTNIANDPQYFNSQMYMVSYDGGTTWKNSGGATYTLPVSNITAEHITTAQYILSCQIALDSNDKPYAMWSVSDPAGYFINNTYYIAYLSSGVWVTKQVPNGATSGYYDIGSMIIDSLDNWYVFGASVDTGDIILQKSINKGVSWSAINIDAPALNFARWLNLKKDMANGFIEIMWASSETHDGQIYYTKFPAP